MSNTYLKQPDAHLHQGQRKQQRGWIVPYVKQYKWPLLLTAIIGTVAVACAGALLFTSGYLISRSSLRPENILMVYVPIVLVRTFGFGKAVVQYLERLASHHIVLRILSRMRIRLYQIIEPQALHFRSRFKSGELLGLLAEDIEQLQHVFLRIVLPSITAVFIYGAGIALLGRMDVNFALLMALYCGFLLFTLPTFALLRSRKLRQQFVAQRSVVYQELTDAVFGMSDWLLSGRSAQFLDEFKKRQQDWIKTEQRMRRAEWRMQWLSQCLIGGAVLLMTLWAGQQSLAGNIRPEWIAAFALITFPLLEALVRAGEAVLRAPDYRSSIQRLQQVEAAGEPFYEVKTKLFSSENNAAPAAMQTTSRQTGVEISLEQVSFRYASALEASIQDVSLHIPSGSQIAIIGRSGAGKSTLLNLIQGELEPDSGTVTVNGSISYEGVREQNGASSRPLFAVLNQKPYLFDTTVMNNIRLARPEATDEDVREAAKLAGIDDLIASLPEGYQTRVQEAGVRFSGGERSRIALARILLQDCPAVLLDEPTVGLDPITERKLVRTIFATLRGKTLVWITHHLTGMEQMDQILFFENGRITMQGTHEQLMAEYERYRKLYALDHPL